MASRLLPHVVALLHFCPSSDAYEPHTLPDIGDTKFIDECVSTHNRFRSEVNPAASDMLYMPGKAHPKFTSVGENLWTGSLSGFTVKEAITAWYKEVGAYSYATNSCKRVCGHYTQIVWAASYKVGCAVHFCPRVTDFPGTNAAHFICNYGPAGNFPRHPYLTGAPCSKCKGEQCADNLCKNAERDKVISDSRWYPDWDRPACDDYCITVIVLRLLLLMLAIPATWVFQKYWSVAPASE
ncbi:glioma pathogenesis-related protein 1-like isoform X2 [Rhea pennata]|uniref:glioma pathogenesis-related protein 1-like isoform X2 n=1 Tax=Rhea pennata TaxID=8795 RepID=UPI002E26F84D